MDENECAQPIDDATLMSMRSTSRSPPQSYLSSEDMLDESALTEEHGLASCPAAAPAAPASPAARAANTTIPPFTPGRTVAKSDTADLQGDARTARALQKECKQLRITAEKVISA
jgi:hypothetical protein